ncbi:MAG: beta-propeller domain-containing protein [Deltaproteobacteria bacterium]|nr:beta-propeller domain-containing protein [Deltaproteobacteria bacterium]
MKRNSCKAFSLLIVLMSLAACGGASVTQRPSIQGMRSFNSCSEMQAVVGSALQNYSYEEGIAQPSEPVLTGAAEGAQADSANAAPTVEGASATEALVEEASLFKVEGNTLYSLSSTGLYVHDISDPQNPQRLHYIAFDFEGSEFYSQQAIEFYVWGSKVAIMAHGPVENYAASYPGSSVDTTLVRIYDLSSPTQPNVLADYTLRGSYLNSRLVQEAQAASIFVVTSDYSSVESLGFNETDCQRSYLPVALEDGMASASHISLYGINLAGESATAEKPLHLFSDGSFINDLYVSPRHLFLPLQRWQEDSTKVFAMALNASDATVESAGDTTLAGSIKNQFDLNESLDQGTLRVVTSTHRWDAGIDSINTLWVLDLKDPTLPVLGQVSFAPPDEVVESSRIYEEVAYVATAVKLAFSDPLIRIDLSDPTDPKVTDEIPLAGRPGYLAVTQENGVDQYLVSIGQDSNQVVAALFDVRAPGSVTMIDQVVVAEDASSLANSFNGHRSVTVLPEGVIFIPIDAWTDTGLSSSLKAYQVTEAGLGLLVSLSHDDLREDDYYGASIERSIEVGDTLYTYSKQGLKVHTMDGILNGLVDELYREVFEDFDAVYYGGGIAIDTPELL